MGIFQFLKHKQLEKYFDKKVAELERLLTEQRRSKKFREQHLIKSRINDLGSLLENLKIFMLFLGDNYADFSIRNQIIGMYSIPNDLKDLNRLEKFKDSVGHIIKGHLTKESSDKLRSFSDVEIERLDEAFLTLRVGAYYSSVVMSVSAVERRLHDFIKRSRPGLYRQQKIDKSPLGSIFNKISHEKRFSAIKKELPEKYFSLINLCNSYRIFSAHPKEEKMNYQDALSIFCLTLSFLLEFHPKRKRKPKKPSKRASQKQQKLSAKKKN